MSLPSLFNVPLTREELDIWTFSNADEHQKIAAACLTQLSATIPQFPLDPIPVDDLGTWAYNHQAIHDAQNAVLGIAGNDLTTVDLNDTAQLSNWIQLHAQEHYQAAGLLGL